MSKGWKIIGERPFLVAILGAVFFLSMREVAYTDHSHRPALKVSGACPNSVSRSSTNTITFEVKNESNESQTVDRFAIGYLGNTGQGVVVSGPFFRQVGPFTLGDDAIQSITLEFPPVPKSYPLGTVITAFGTIFTGSAHLGSGGCLAPVSQ